MSDLYEYQAIDGSSKGPISLVLLIQARNHGRLSNRTLVRKLPDGGWQPLSSFIPSMTVMDADMEESAVPEPETGGEPAIPAWTRKKYWTCIIKGWCSFEGRAGKQEMREVYSTIGIAWLVVAGVPSIMKSGFFPCPPCWSCFFPWLMWCFPCCFSPWRLRWCGACMMWGKAAFS